MVSIPSSLFGIFVLIFCALSPVSSNFELTINLSCDGFYANWCAHIFIYEDDAITKHDFIAEKFVCAPMNDHYANITVPFGYIRPFTDWTPHYELVPMISHNCSRNAQVMCQTPKEPIDIPAWTYNDVKLDFCLSERKDSKGQCVHPETES